MTNAQKNIRSVVMRIIANHTTVGSTKTGIDKDRWLTCVMDDLQNNEPVTMKAIHSFAAGAWIRGRLEEFIRSNRSPLITNTAAIDKLVAHAKTMNETVQIQIAGRWIAKRINDCTADELVTLGEQYIKSGTTGMRKGRFFQVLGGQMQLAGHTGTLEQYLKTV